jgi:hypothetical protein
MVSLPASAGVVQPLPKRLSAQFPVGSLPTRVVVAESESLIEGPAEPIIGKEFVIVTETPVCPATVVTTGVICPPLYLIPIFANRAEAKVVTLEE